MSTNRKPIYQGGTFNTIFPKGFRRTDAELIKIDLLNHLFTLPGQSPHNLDFGTNIHDLLFENLDDLLKTRVANEIQTVIDYDPRVELLNMSVDVDEANNALTVDILVRFIEIEVIDNINLNLPLGV